MHARARTHTHAHLIECPKHFQGHSIYFLHPSLLGNSEAGEVSRIQVVPKARDLGTPGSQIFEATWDGHEGCMVSMFISYIWLDTVGSCGNANCDCKHFNPANWGLARAKSHQIGFDWVFSSWNKANPQRPQQRLKECSLFENWCSCLFSCRKHQAAFIAFLWGE